jgi:hypothetical protein
VRIGLIRIKRGRGEQTYRHRPNLSAQTGARKMLDLVMVALGLAFFALSVGYTIACDRL